MRASHGHWASQRDTALCGQRGGDLRVRARVERGARCLLGAACLLGPAACLSSRLVQVEGKLAVPGYPAHLGPLFIPACTVHQRLKLRPPAPCPRLLQYAPLKPHQTNYYINITGLSVGDVPVDLASLVRWAVGLPARAPQFPF